MTRTLVCLTTLLLSSPLHAQSPAEKAVLAAEEKGCLAYQNHDVEGVRAFLMDDYTLTDSKGVVTTRQDDLDDFLKDRIRYTTFRNQNMKVRVHGDTAVVTGQTLVAGTAQGKPVDVEVQFTDTLVREHGRWRLEAGHVSRLRNGPA